MNGLHLLIERFDYVVQNELRPNIYPCANLLNFELQYPEDHVECHE